MRFALPCLQLCILYAGCGGGAFGPLQLSGAYDAGIDGPHLTNSTSTTNNGGSDESFPAVTAHAGIVLEHPALVSIVYADDTRASQLFAFADYITTSAWLTTVGADYGVDSGVSAGKVTLSENSPTALTDAQIITRINQVMTSGDFAAPTADPSSLVFLFYTPSHTAVTGSDGQILCNTYAAYHASATINSVAYTYAVIPACSTDIHQITYDASHELIEAATDPFNDPNAGYYLDLDLPSPWYLEPLEVADLCEDEAANLEDGYGVTRVWSTTAARAGNIPCIPWPATTPYYNVHISPNAAATVAPGGSATFIVTGFAINGYAKSWTLDLAPSGVIADFTPTASLSATTIAVNASVTLTVTAPSTAKSGDVGGLRVYSDEYRYWPVVITVQ